VFYLREMHTANSTYNDHELDISSLVQ